MKLEDYLNHHLDADFLFVGVTTVDPEKKKQEEEEEAGTRIFFFVNQPARHFRINHYYCS